MRPVIQEAKERYANSKIKKHFVDNKNLYLTGAVCLVVGALVAKQGESANSNATMKMIAYKPQNVSQNLEQTTVLVRRGHPGNVVKCVETGELFASQNRAASALGIDAAGLSRHLQGKNPHVGGLTFENLGEAA